MTEDEDDHLPEGEEPDTEDARPARRHRATGRISLDKWAVERDDQHRALLLLAIQDPGINLPGVCGGRSMGAVMRCGWPRNTLRKMRARYSWDDRIAAHGAEAQTRAIELYRALYYTDFAAADLREIGPLCSRPMQSARLSEVQEAAQALVERMLPPPNIPPGFEEKVQAKVDERRQQLADTNRALRGTALQAIQAIQLGLRALTDPDWLKAENERRAALGVGAPPIVPMTVRLSDLDSLHTILARLENERELLESPEIAAAKSGPGAIDSIRVRIAKETGGNVLDAVAADCRELLAMIDGLRAGEVSIDEMEAQRVEELRSELGAG